MTRQAHSRRLVHAAAAAAVLAAGPVAASAAGQDDGTAARHGLALRLDTLSGNGSRIGVTVHDIEPGAATASDPVEGAVVSEVRSGSAAADAGFEAGDVIVQFDGARVRGARQFARLVRETPVGRGVAATVVRGTERRELPVAPEPGGSRMAFLPEAAREGIDRAVDRLRRRSGAAGERPSFRMELFAPRRLGIRAQAIEGQLADYFGIDGGSGVLITSVEDESAAARAGLRAGDVITAVGEHPVADVPALRRRLAAEPAAGDVAITVVRDGSETRVTAEFDASEGTNGGARIRT
ncbi:MAG: PDZ domain-containing protein [Acidobacteria bacterium]|nr:PDZ domain-containing protein [Acidobacteriota bacterium]